MHQYVEQDKYWIWLASMPEVTPKTFYYILNQFGCALSFFDAVGSVSDKLEVMPEKVITAAKSTCSKQYIAELVCQLNAKGIHAVTRLSDSYPALLKNILYPPPVLYVKGSLDNTDDTFSIVGTRRPTRHGEDIAKKIASELGANGKTIVSGMAYGIDTAAHEGALKAGAKTIAVLGCGVDIVYPQKNEELYCSIISSGAVISELNSGTLPLSTNFPARNRIITGLSRGTLIVESEIKGGTAISANMAIAQKRDVFAVPGMSIMSALPNLLIKKGAVPATCANDILRFYGKKTLDFSHNNEISSEQLEIQLDFLQRHIYNLLLKGDMSVENIADSIEYSQSEINSTLTIMELSGFIKRLPGGKYGI